MHETLDSAASHPLTPYFNLDNGHFGNYPQILCREEVTELHLSQESGENAYFTQMMDIDHVCIVF